MNKVSINLLLTICKLHRYDKYIIRDKNHRSIIITGSNLFSTSGSRIIHLCKFKVCNIDIDSNNIQYIELKKLN